MNQTLASDNRPAALAAIERFLDRTWSFLSRPWPAVGFLYLVWLAVVTGTAEVDPDLFHRVAVGRLVELIGGVVHHDPFGFSPKLETWVDHEWLSGVIFYQLTQLGGDAALLVFDASVMLLTAFLIVWAHKRWLNSDRVLLPWLLLTLAFVSVVWASVVRCRVFTFLFIAVFFNVYLKWREGEGKWLWVLPPLFVLWMNLHGGVAAGFGLFAATAVAATIEDRRRAIALWTCLVVSGLATLINPYGPRLWVYLLSAVTMDRPGITEWQSPSIGSVLIIVLLVATVFGGGLLSRRKPHAETWILVSVALLATFRAQRIVNFLLLILAIFGAPSVQKLVPSVKRLFPTYRMAGQRIVTLLFLMLFTFSGVASVRNLAHLFSSGLPPGHLPVAAVSWLEREGGGGRLLVSFNEGSYALWRLYPSYQVSMDGRYEEVYPQSTVDLVSQALSPDHPGRMAAISELDPDYILVDRAGKEGVFPEEWEVVFENNDSRILARNHIALLEPRPARGRWTPGF